MVEAVYSYRRRSVQESLSATSAGNADMVICGDREGVQIQIQDSTNTNVRLLHDRPDPKVAPQAELADLARQVNNFFEGKAKQLLLAKRAANPNATSAERVEITVLLTDHGLQLAYAHGLEEKEIAPTPHKTLGRRLLGPLYPIRHFWEMPKHHTTKNKVRTAWWGLLFWILLLVAAAGFTFYSTVVNPGAFGMPSLKQ